ncbi:MAG: TIGR04255 family protein [Acidobacteriota bacterium]
MPEGITGELAGFLARLNIRQGENSAIMTQALERSLAAGSVSIILDIDVYRLNDFEIDSTELREAFDRLHGFKNEFFFAGITERTAGLFE